MAINVLNDSIINKIAAGEAIERPANVIKEILENSIDSGADEIKIEIIDSGLTKIRISDNGSGMSREDLLICYKRHTTSKINKESDLNEIQSLGFRGEALASIAEVSNLRIKTKAKDSEVGYSIEVEGGILLSNQKVGCSDGTTIEIENLFYNVPARKKFLKTPEVELAHIIDIVTRYALIKKEIAISLTHNKKEIINSQKTESQLNNLIYIYGTEITKNLIEVDYKKNKIAIKGYISKPSLTRANKNEQSFFVNSRYVKSMQISEAIYLAYHTFLFTNRHPLYVLELIINPKEIDVNVHPNKLDIRIHNEQEICENFFSAIKETLKNQILIPTTTAESETKRKPITIYPVSKDKQENLFIQEYEIKKAPEKIEDKPLISENNRSLNPFLDFAVIGQIQKTYIIAENSQGFAIIDQHAAEERVNYERFLSELKQGAIKKQRLLHPKIIRLNPNQYQKTKVYKDFIKKLGFDFEEFGELTVKLSSVPEIFNKINEELFIDIINEITKLNTKYIDKEIEDKIISFACKASVKAGQELSMTQMNELIKKLGDSDNPYSCPHGRPTVIQLTNADLEKKFKRSGW